MKNVVLVLLVVVGTFGCRKSHNSSITPINSNYEYKVALARLDTVRISIADYKRSHSYSATQRKTTVSKDWIKIGVADFSGGVAGFKAGTRIGTFLGDPPLGAAVGIVLGAIVGSMYHAWFVGFEPNGNPTQTWANSYNDDYEMCGLSHNNGCISVFDSLQANYNYPFSTNAGTFTSNIYPYTLKHVSSVYNVNLQLLIDSTSVQEMIDFNTRYNSESSLDSNMAVLGDFVSNQKILSYVHDMSYDLLDCDRNDTSNVFGLCDAYMAVAVSDPSLTTNEKIYIFRSIALCKYSLALWNSN